MSTLVETRCPYCGEPTSVELDSMVEGSQAFVSDCEVCCKPIQFRASFDEDGEARVDGLRDDG
jgi:hypothetical protein